jgi:hypothetical protein
VKLPIVGPGYVAGAFDGDGLFSRPPNTRHCGPVYVRIVRFCESFAVTVNASADPAVEVPATATSR